jgi:hypothetical protein
MVATSGEALGASIRPSSSCLTIRFEQFLNEKIYQQKNIFGQKSKTILMLAKS